MLGPGLFVSFYDVDDSDYGCVDGAIFTALRHPRRAALYNEHCLAEAGPDRVDGDDVALLVRAVDSDRPHDQELAAMKPVVFSCGNDGADDSGKYH